MKTVFTNSALAHAWFHQGNDTHGRGNNMYFEHGVVYSYGPHFPIAQKIQTPAGLVVLHTTDQYGQATAKHLNHVWRAIDRNACEVIRVNLTRHGVLDLDHAPSMNARVEAMIREEIEAMRSFLEEAQGPRIRVDTREGFLRSVSRHGNTARQLAKLRRALDHTAPTALPAEVLKLEAQAAEALELLGSDLAAFQAKAKAQRAAREQKRAEQAKREAEERDQRWEREAAPWRACTPGARSPGNRPVEAHENPTGRWQNAYAMRVCAGHVETSGGVRIPVSVARRLFTLAKGALEGDAEAARALKALGNIAGFPVHLVHKSGWQIGCHWLPAEELRGVLVKLSGEGE